MTHCSACGHPGAHAVTILEGGYPERCGDCRRCALEANDRQES
jgi:hypothetical protein